MRTNAGGCRCALQILALGLAGCSQSVTWTQFDDAKGVTYYYDPASIRRFVDGKVRVAVLEDYAGPMLDKRTGEDYVSMKQFWELDCRLKTLARLSVVQFSGHKGNGNNLSDTSDERLVYADPQTLRDRSHDEDPRSVRMVDIDPGTPAATMLETVCDRGR